MKKIYIKNIIFCRTYYFEKENSKNIFLIKHHRDLFIKALRQSLKKKKMKNPVNEQCF